MQFGSIWYHKSVLLKQHAHTHTQTNAHIQLSRKALWQQGIVLAPRTHEL